ncbi:XrtA/PEP-CTERM system TPR-repeat protein PrsT [Roseateles sp. LKC17W]|uniref:XrtA/PEP-CTERM system TPR-repeat protein PrsT n=1 Tax=Pelomonas margarita TaxID=3299031 RepID=A0ABW7FII6_9BURK
MTTLKKQGRPARRMALLPALLAAVLLSACGRMTVDQLVESADGYVKKGDTKAAMIQLKEALSQDPNVARARFMLGSVLLEIGEAASAVVELRKAQQLNYPQDELVAPLARALVAAGQHKVVVDEFAALSPSQAATFADLKTSIATAQASLGKAGEARAALAQALAKVPDYPKALMLQARLAGYEGRTDEALALADRVLALTPNDASAWFQKGELLMLGRRDSSKAQAAFQKALEIQPSHVSARAASVELLIARKEMKEAEQQLSELKKASGNRVLISYLEAQLAFAGGDLKKAAAASELALKGAPEEVSVLQLAGNVQLATGALLQAERTLSKALSIRPAQPGLRTTLAQTYLRMGEPAKALSTLQPLLVSGSAGALVHGLAGEAELLQGHLEASRAQFERAVKLNPNDTASLTKLALARQGTAGYAATKASLRKIAAEDRVATSADLALISLLLANQELPEALKAIDSIEAKLPKNPLPHNLRAKVQVQVGDIASARASLDKALAIDPTFFPAVASHAALDLRQQNLVAAKGRFEALLKAKPKHVEALLALAKLSQAEGASPAVITDLLAQAIRGNPTEPAPRLQLIELQLGAKDIKAAQATAREAISALPDEPDLLDALGRSEAAAGEIEQALAAFNKLVTLEPKSVRPFMRLAGVQVAAGKAAAAEQSLKKALSLDATHLPAQQALVKVALAKGRADEAIAMAREVQKQRPSETTGLDLEAEIHLAKGKSAEAVDVYRKALKTRPASILAVKLHMALRGAKRDSEAAQWAEDWIKAQPRDAGFPAYLGDVALRQQQFDVAERQFRRVVELLPENSDALNNIAYAMARQGKSGGMAFVERALKLRPDSPGYLDTQAAVLAADKQLVRALEVQRRAVTLDGDNGILRLNLAKLLIEAGDKAAAKKELTPLKDMGVRFAAHAEVARLWAAL